MRRLNLSVRAETYPSVSVRHSFGTTMPQVQSPGASILVADASPQMAALVAAMLRQLGYRQVCEASSSTEALAMLELRQVQAIVVGDTLAPISGAELTRRLRELKDNPNRDAVVMMMSANPSAAGIAAARDAGITEFLRKPFSLRDLGHRLDAALGAPRPVVDAQSYHGPDRRRRSATYTGTDRRNRS
jgi:two-component system chemotaxis response regulator CheY